MSISKDAGPGEMGIITEDVSLSYNGHLVLGSVSLHLKKGAVITLLGPNGCGKTTLLKVINFVSLHCPRYRAHWKNASYLCTGPTWARGCRKSLPGSANGRSVSSFRQTLHPNQRR